MTLQNAIAEEFSLSPIEAGEVERKALVLADKFVAMRTAYSIDYLTESEAYAEKRKKEQFKTGWKGLVSKATNQLSGGAKRMWRCYKECKASGDNFSTVCRVHGVVGGVEEILTRTFELAHQKKRLKRPEEVAEGRRLFGNLQRAANNHVLRSQLEL